MPYTEEGMILSNNLLKLEAHNGKHLVREFPQGLNVGLVCQLLQKLWVTGGSTVDLAATDDAAAQLITLILLTNWCYAKMAKREIILAHCTYYYDLSLQRIINIG